MDEYLYHTPDGRRVKPRTPVTNLGLTDRLVIGLHAQGVFRMRDFSKVSRYDLKKIPWFGNRRIKQIAKWLYSRGQEYQPDPFNPPHRVAADQIPDVPLTLSGTSNYAKTLANKKNAERLQREQKKRAALKSRANNIVHNKNDPTGRGKPSVPCMVVLKRPIP